MNIYEFLNEQDVRKAFYQGSMKELLKVECERNKLSSRNYVLEDEWEMLKIEAEKTKRKLNFR